LPVSTSEWHKWLVGIVYAEVEVERDRGPRARVRFLVDSGAAYAVLPFEVWQKLGLKAKRTLDFSLADGTTIRRRLSECRFRYQGLDAASPVVLGEPGDAALLGTVTLENLGLVLNPFDRTLGPMRLTLASVPARAGYP
jgi:clan AA aspartic protease